MTILRFLKIIIVFQRYRLYHIFNSKRRIYTLLPRLIWLPARSKTSDVAVRFRLALEELGPVFVKFGQLLSTRPDIIPQRYIVELSTLQNKVKPFSGQLAQQIVERSLKLPIAEVFSYFSEEAVASASIAQVHYAVLRSTNTAVAVKVLRPDARRLIIKDIQLLYKLAWLIAHLLPDGRLLRPKEVVTEFNKTMHAELDFLQESANATELYRLHRHDPKILIPRIFYDYCSSEVIVLEWMDGISISDLNSLRAYNIDLEQLSHNGVAIFYTQVFNYGFFHADMHPGNILCTKDGRYIALDFGIVGCLSQEDKRYLAINILAFFNRDYKKVAITHVESGWAPDNTSIEELENAIRAVCEPIFNKPLAQISFGQVLIKLLQVSRRFNISVQPQLILLQKTIVNVEGLGRMLNPNLDLWQTAKPILEKWMREQMGWKGFMRNIRAEIPHLAYTLPTLPRRFSSSIGDKHELYKWQLMHQRLNSITKRQNLLLVIIIALLVVILLR